MTNKTDIVVLSDGTLVTDCIDLGPPQLCTLKAAEPMVWTSREAVGRSFPFHKIGPAYAWSDTWQADVYVRGTLMGYLRNDPSEVRVLSALEADEGEG